MDVSAHVAPDGLARSKRADRWKQRKKVTSGQSETSECEREKE